MQNFQVLVAEQTGLSLRWSVNSEDRFSQDEVHFIDI